MITQHRSYSSTGAVDGYDLIILDERTQEKNQDVQRQKMDTLELCRGLTTEHKCRYVIALVH